MIRPRVLEAHVAARDRAGHQIRAAFDAIRQHFVCRAVQLLHALHDDLVRAGALDLRAHRDEEVREVDHFGLARRVLDDGFAVRERRGHHQVLGARDRDGVEHQPRALQPPRARADVAAFDADVRAHRLQPGDVNVHRPRADGAAAGQRDVRLAEARHQRAEHEDGRAHRLHELVRRRRIP